MDSPGGIKLKTEPITTASSFSLYIPLEPVGNHYHRHLKENVKPKTPISVFDHSGIPGLDSRKSQASTEVLIGQHDPGPRSVKYLTCWYWREHGHCRKADDECLYSHHDTGLYADKPRILRPGGEHSLLPRVRIASNTKLERTPGPAVAGKNALVSAVNLNNDSIWRETYGKSSAYRGPEPIDALETSSSALLEDDASHIDPHSFEALEIMHKRSKIEKRAAGNNAQRSISDNFHTRGKHERRLTVGAERLRTLPAASTPNPLRTSLAEAASATSCAAGPSTAAPTSFLPTTTLGSGLNIANLSAPGGAYNDSYVNIGLPIQAKSMGDSTMATTSTNTFMNNVQTTMVARRLDQSLCLLMNGSIDLSRMLFDLQRKFPGAGGADLAAVQGLVASMYAQAASNRATAQILLKEEPNFDAVFGQGQV